MTKNKLSSDIFPERSYTQTVPSLVDVENTLKSELSYKFNGFFSDNQVEKIVSAFYAAKDDWSSGFGGQQYSLGEAWYHYVETGKDGNPVEYMDRAVPSRKIVEKHIPGLHDYVLSFLSKLYPDQEVGIRDHWAGPGIVTFLANNYVARNGGGIHFDTDGLTNEELKNPDFELRSYVSTLQKPKTGGDLRLWNFRYDHNIGEEILENPANYKEVNRSRVVYKQGDLYMFDGLKAHKIEPFEGDQDRVCLTFHTAKRGRKLDVWF